MLNRKEWFPAAILCGFFSFSKGLTIDMKALRNRLTLLRCGGIIHLVNI